MIDLIPMTGEDFSHYRHRAAENYAAENVRAGRVKPELAVEEAERTFRALLPNGVGTRDHLIYNACDGDERIGIVWLSLRRSEGMIWIYDLIVHEEHRRRGYGMKILRAVEERAREIGADRISLHVFGHNPGARNLYERAEYETTSVVMTRHL